MVSPLGHRRDSRSGGDLKPNSIILLRRGLSDIRRPFLHVQINRFVNVDTYQQVQRLSKPRSFEG
jgi:hypothetical protein